jgi:hypothetical protein
MQIPTDRPDLVRAILERNEKYPHRKHQLEGVLALLKHPYFGLYDEVGAGKTKQVVDTSQILFTNTEIDTVLVITPGFARSTWADDDPLLGEVAKHAWESIPNVIHEYHKNYSALQFHPNALNWVVTNYEFVRRDDRLYDLEKLLRTRRTWLVLDESWAIKGNSDTMKACRRLRFKRCTRVVELNGTPLSDGKPEDLYYPMMVLDPDILGVQNRVHFRSKYCIMGGYDGKKVVDYQNLDEFNRRIAPYVLSRKTRECFDLPPMLDPIIVEARLSPSTWAIYKDMRDEMVSQLGTMVSTAQQAIVKSLRLAQITSGYLGGLEDLLGGDDNVVVEEGAAPVQKPTLTDLLGPQPAWLRRTDEQAQTIQAATPAQTAAVTSVGAGPVVGRTGTGLVREIGREKLDAFLNWIDTREPLPHKLLTWCRFSPELRRTVAELGKIYPHVFELRGGQSKDERRKAKEFLAPGSDGRSGAVVGNQKAGGASLNFSAANIAVYLSNGPALIERTQSIGRIERPGATQPMLIVDVLATGPKGQKTIDHAILKALRSKDDMARWTVEQWRQILAAA